MTDLQSLIERVERLVDLDLPVPTPAIPTDAYGNPAPALPGDLIQAEWGNAATDRAHHTFPNFGELSTWVLAAEGTFASTADDNKLYKRRNGLWVPTYVMGTPIATSGTIAEVEIASMVLPAGSWEVVHIFTPFVNVVGPLEFGRLTYKLNGVMVASCEASAWWWPNHKPEITVPTVTRSFCNMFPIEQPTPPEATLSVTYIQTNAVGGLAGAALTWSTDGNALQNQFAAMLAQ